MFKNILLATDGSAASETAAKMAVELARGHGAKLTAVYVVDPYPYLGISDTNPMGMNAYLTSAREHGAAAHARVVALCGGPGPSVDLHLRLLEDVTAPKGIVALAKQTGADLVVVGSHGRTGLDSLLLGSVATKLASLCPVPLLIAR
jgi:nucleotide-binding universal stress UspA family protein